MSVTHKTTHVVEAAGLIIGPLQDKPKFLAKLTSYINRVQELEDAIYAVHVGRWIDNAVGAQLDGLGEIVGVERRGRTDEVYRVRLKVQIRINTSSGTAEDILAVIGMLTTATPVYRDTPPAAFVVEVNDAVADEAVADEIAEVVGLTRAGGVNGQVISNVDDEDNIFIFADGTTQDTDPDHGFATPLPTLSLLASTSLQLVADDWDGSSSTWIDRSTGGNNAVKVGTPTLEDSTTFAERKCIRGGSGKGFHAPGDDFAATTQRTYEIVLDDFGTSALQYVIGRHEGSFAQFGVWLYKASSTQLESFVLDGTHAHPWIGSDSYTGPSKDGLPVICHVVVDAVARTQKVYVNGVMITQNNNFLFGSLSTPTGLHLGIMGAWNNAGSFQPEYFNGTLLELLRHEVAMDAATVAARSADFLATYAQHVSGQDAFLAGGVWSTVRQT